MKILVVINQYLTGSGIGSQFIRSMIGSAGLRIVGMAITFVVGIQLARALGVEGYGVYGVAMSVISLLAIPAEFGFPPLLIREVAANQVTENWGRIRGVLFWATKASLEVSILIVIAVISWILVAEKDINQPLVSTLIAGLLMVPMGVLGRQKGAALLGLHHPIKGQLPELIIRPVFFSILLMSVTLLSFQHSAALAMLLGTMSAAIAYLFGFLMLRAALPPEIQTANKILDVRNWWMSALPMAATEGMRVLQGNIAILVLNALATASSVGLFRVASSVSLIVTMPLTLFLVIAQPLISRLYTQGDHNRLQRLLTWLAVGMTLGSILLTLPFLIAGAPLLGYVFGQDFSHANTSLLIMCIGSILFSAFGASVVLLNMCGHEKRVTFSFAVSLITLLIFVVPLTHLYNENGAAIASSISMLLGGVIMWKDAQRLLEFDTSIFSLFKRMTNDEI